MDVDLYMKSIPTDKRQKQCLALDKAFSNIQGKIAQWDLCKKFGTFVDKQRYDTRVSFDEASNDDNQEELQESLETANTFCDLMEKSVSVLGQAFSYYRRRNILTSVIGDKKKVKDILHENLDVLQESMSDKLFGERFNERIIEQIKVKKRSKEFMNVSAEGVRPSTSASGGARSPFRASSLLQYRNNSSRGQNTNYFKRNNSYQGKRSKSSNYFF